jgi:hypothetical protein
MFRWGKNISCCYRDSSPGSLCPWPSHYTGNSFSAPCLSQNLEDIHTHTHEFEWSKWLHMVAVLTHSGAFRFESQEGHRLACLSLAAVFSDLPRKSQYNILCWVTTASCTAVQISLLTKLQPLTESYTI